MKKLKSKENRKNVACKICRFAAAANIAFLALVAFSMQACSDDSSSASGESCEGKGCVETCEGCANAATSEVFVYGTDFSAGELRWIVDGKISEESFEFGSDTKLVAANGNLFVHEGYGADNISLVNAETHEVEWQTALDDASNPKDIVMADSKTAWVALEGAEKFVRINIENGKVTETVKTGAFTQKDGISPGLIDFETHGDTLFALFQRYAFDSETYNTYLPAVGLVALYTLDKGELLDTIPLNTKNPNAMAYIDGALFVTTLGEYNDSWGTDADSKRGIEKIDLGKKSADMAELLIDGKKLGGGIYNAAFDIDAGIVYAAIYKSMGDAPLIAYDIESGKVKEIDIADAEGGLFFDDSNGLLYVGDRSYGAEAVYTYDGDKVKKIEQPKGTLAPYSIAKP
ncbi:hypothetical protein [Fibrobacter sp.]|uniref:hypothetical protein n=1 Tax=Fibrobacter sp. TaxID=35828 RepID=UPI0038909CB1